MPIDSHLSYFDKNTFVPIGSEGYRIEGEPHPELGMVVVIPCFDEPDLIGSLQALLDSEPAECAVEVITVINSGVRDSAEVRDQNAATLREASSWAHTQGQERLQFHFLHFPDLPHKHAGVGLARKIGMDLAAYRLQQAGQPNAPIVCFDADSRCEPNYLKAIETHFANHPKAGYASLHFEHPLQGEQPQEVYDGILRYELYLRYYVNGLRFAGSPYGHHTIGSSMAVRASLYTSQGGMNRRKAGEDFYFLNKLPRSGHSKLTTTAVIPSPRPSHRVPFGTGKAIDAWLESPDEDYPVYAPDSFQIWSEALSGVASWYSLDENALQAVLLNFSPSLRAYLESIDFVKNVRECQRHTTTASAFSDRYHHWLNGLRTLQFFHYLRDHHLPNVPISEAARTLLERLKPQHPGGFADMDMKEMLLFYRAIDRGNL